jgi:arsenite methyltransferase
MAMSQDMPEPESQRVLQGIKAKYDQVATAGPGGRFRYPTGREGLERLGYPPEILETLPAAVLATFCGVGNPFSLGPLQPGEAVLDIGCGAGVDALVAASLVGPGGRVVGIDVTTAMLETARANLAQLNWPQVSFEPADAEHLPFPAGDFNAVISNGVFNLTLNKGQALAEAHRVLKPGGRLLLADMVLVSKLPPEVGDKVENWFQ